MQPVVIAKPYRFVPPQHGALWPALFRHWLPRYLRKSFGVEHVHFRHVERLKQSLDEKAGIMLAPNHCRPCDPMVLGLVANHIHRPLYIMASWHLFMQSRVQSFLLPRLGVFSIYREGLDRDALKCAIQLLCDAKRPLVVFPEGVISRHNDRLNHLMEGTALMLRAAARQRGREGRVVVHPVAIRYFFDGDIDLTLRPVLADIERRLAWQTQDSVPLVDRVLKVGAALLTLKEMEHFGVPQSGTLSERVANLVDGMLRPLENEWLKGRHGTDVVARVKLLRTAIVPDLIHGELPAEEAQRRWRQLEVIYLAQQIAFYPAGYFTPSPTPERLLETVEKFEEDLTDACRVHAPLRAVVDIGEAIEVPPEKSRDRADDDLMDNVRDRLEDMLSRSLVDGRSTR